METRGTANSSLVRQSNLTASKVLFPITVNLETKDGGDAATVAREVQSWLRMDQFVQEGSAIDITVTSGDKS